LTVETTGGWDLMAVATTAAPGSRARKARMAEASKILTSVTVGLAAAFLQKFVTKARAGVDVPGDEVLCVTEGSFEGDEGGVVAFDREDDVAARLESEAIADFGGDDDAAAFGESNCCGECFIHGCRPSVWRVFLIMPYCVGGGKLFNLRQY